MAADLGLYLNSINTTKKNVMRDPEANPSVIAQYPAYIINKLLSYHEDCVLIVNALNRLSKSNLDNQLQYEFLLHALSKKKRFSKLHREIVPENLAAVKKYYRYNTARAMEVLELHTEEQLKLIHAELSEGGILRETKSKNRNG